MAESGFGRNRARSGLSGARANEAALTAGTGVSAFSVIGALGVLSPRGASSGLAAGGIDSPEPLFEGVILASPGVGIYAGPDTFLLF